MARRGDRRQAQEATRRRSCSSHPCESRVKGEWMRVQPGKLTIPADAIVEVENEPSPELFAQHGAALTSLLRLALLSGTELTLPTALQLVLDTAQTLVNSDRQLICFAPAQAPQAWERLGHGIELGTVPEENVLNAWVGHVGKPVLVTRGRNVEVDAYLDRLQAKVAAAVPLFLQHGWAGSLQLFRIAERHFNETEARLTWILSLLAENQMAAIESMRQLTQLASTDYLTGLRARGYFERALEQEVHRCLRRSSPSGLLLLDLDDFKAVNDRWGHQAGDDVLRQFARLLPLGLREVDTVARFGGDEFALILPDTGAEGLRLVAERVSESVEQFRFRLPECEQDLHLHLSLGQAVCPDQGRSAEQVLRAADASLYEAKRHKQPLWHGVRHAS